MLQLCLLTWALALGGAFATGNVIGLACNATDGTASWTSAQQATSYGVSLDKITNYTTTDTTYDLSADLVTGLNSYYVWGISASGSLGAISSCNFVWVASDDDDALSASSSSGSWSADDDSAGEISIFVANGWTSADDASFVIADVGEIASAPYGQLVSGGSAPAGFFNLTVTAGSVSDSALDFQLRDTLPIYFVLFEKAGGPSSTNTDLVLRHVPTTFEDTYLYSGNATFVMLTTAFGQTVDYYVGADCNGQLVGSVSQETSAVVQTASLSDSNFFSYTAASGSVELAACIDGDVKESLTVGVDPYGVYSLLFVGDGTPSYAYTLSAWDLSAMASEGSSSSGSSASSASSASGADDDGLDMPTVEFTATPNLITSSNVTTFGVAADQDDVTFTLCLDYEYENCSTAATTDGAYSFTYYSLQEGDHHAALTAMGASGYASDEVDYDWTLDESAPYVSVYPSDYYPSAPDINITVSCWDIYTSCGVITLTMNGAFYGLYNSDDVVPITLSSEGTYTFTAQASDPALNMGSASVDVVYTTYSDDSYSSGSWGSGSFDDDDGTSDEAHTFVVNAVRSTDTLSMSVSGVGEIASGVVYNTVEYTGQANGTYTVTTTVGGESTSLSDVDLVSERFVYLTMGLSNSDNTLATPSVRYGATDFEQSYVMSGNATLILLNGADSMDATFYEGDSCSGTQLGGVISPSTSSSTELSSDEVVNVAPGSALITACYDDGLVATVSVDFLPYDIYAAVFTGSSVDSAFLPNMTIWDLGAEVEAASGSSSFSSGSGSWSGGDDSYSSGSTSNSSSSASGSSDSGSSGSGFNSDSSASGSSDSGSSGSGFNSSSSASGSDSESSASVSSDSRASGSDSESSASVSSDSGASGSDSESSASVSSDSGSSGSEGGGQPPVISVPASVFVSQSEEAPGTVTFDASGTTDPEGLSMTYAWTFGDDCGNMSSPTLDESVLEVYNVYSRGYLCLLTLTVTDADDLSSTAMVALQLTELAFTAPAVGATLVQGSSYTVSWSAAGFSGNDNEVWLTLSSGDAEVLALQSGSPLDSDEFTFTVPSDYTGVSYNGDDFSLSLTVADSMYVSTAQDSDVSASFSILPTYQFQTGDWGNCSEPCGLGTQTRDVTCEQTDGGVEVDAYFCSQYGAAPVSEQDCLEATCESYAWFTGDWSTDCVTTKEDQRGDACGAGTVSRDVTCVDSALSTVADSFCANLTEPDSTDYCSAGACYTWAWTVSGTGPCSTECGGGTQSLLWSCRNEVTGRLTTDAMCSDADDDTLRPASQACNTDACPSYSWVYGSYSVCDEICGGGTKTRSASCVSDSGAAASDADCEAASGDAATTAVCNSFPCVYYSYVVGSYSSECVVTDGSSCGDGAYSRTVRCLNSDTGAISDDTSACESALGYLPASTSACTVDCNFCDSTDCSNAGSCNTATEICECDAGFSGTYCAVGEACAADQVVDGYGDCCTGVILPATSECCEGVLDGSGACCASGELDACGACCDDSGNCPVADLYGVCCDAGNLDASGECCLEGDLDACQVCGGDGSSCATAVAASTSTGAAEDSCANYDSDATLVLEGLQQSFADLLGVDVSVIEIANGVCSDSSTTARRLLSYDVAADYTVLPAASVDAFTVSAALDADESLSVSSLETVGVCGNGVCEAGEACDAASTDCCSADCPISAQECPIPEVGDGTECGSHGTCVSSSGACECFAAQGYSGDACDVCLPGFYLADDGVSCAAQVYSTIGILCTDGVQDGDETGVDCGGSCPDSCPESDDDDDSSETTIVLATVIPSVALIAAVAAFVYRRFQMQNESRAHLTAENGSAHQSTATVEMFNPAAQAITANNNSNNVV